MRNLEMLNDRFGQIMRLPVCLGASVGLVWFGTCSSATADQGLLTSVMCILTAIVLSLTALTMTIAEFQRDPDSQIG